MMKSQVIKIDITPNLCLQVYKTTTLKRSNLQIWPAQVTGLLSFFGKYTMDTQPMLLQIQAPTDNVQLLFLI